MIKSIEVKNFQSHKHTFLELHEGVNVLCGPSDSGKTAILRALNWLANNKPSGDEFSSHWGGDTEVSVVLDSGVKVSRIRNKTINEYRLSTHDKPFTGFGVNVPLPVKEALNLSDVNFQFQLSGPFLLSDKGGEVSRHLNKVAQLEKIDNTISSIGSILREEKQELSRTKVETEKLSKEVQEFLWIDEADTLLSNAEILDKEINNEVKKANDLENLIKAYRTTEEKFVTLSWVKGAKDEIDTLIPVEKALNSLKGKRDSLKAKIVLYKKLDGRMEALRPYVSIKEDVFALFNLYNEITRQKEVQRGIQGKLDNLKKREARIKALSPIVECKVPIEALLKYNTLIDREVDRADKLEGAIRKVRELEDKVLKSKIIHARLEREFKSQFPETCPLCGK